MKTRVLLIGPFGPGQLAESFARAFERLDYEVFRFDSDRAYFEAGRWALSRLARRALRRVLWDRLNLSTVEVVQCVRPAFILAVKGTYLHAETIRRLRMGLGVPFVNYYSDNPFCGVPWSPRKSSTQRRDLMEVLREYTRVWIWERGMAARLRAGGAEAGYLPFGVDAEISRPMSPGICTECGQSHGVVFIGQHSDKRERHLAAVRRHSVALWGSRWSRASGRFDGRHGVHRGAAFGTACAQWYASADVSLNIVDDLNMPGHNMRTFEVPGAGGAMLSTYTPEQAEFFPENEAALYYREPHEIDEKIEIISSDRARSARIRRQASRIAQQHSYTERVKVMVAELGL